MSPPIPWTRTSSTQGCRGRGGAGCHCDDCEEWRRYCYWNHDHGHTKQFLLFASDEKDYLCLPWEVTSQLGDMIPASEPVKLEAPDGRMYSVEFVKIGLITLTTGWRCFVDANHIRQGDPILFVYCGGSSFKVHICSSSSPENSLPCSQQPPDIFRAVPPRDRHVLNEQVVPDPAHVRTSTDIGYTMFPGTCLTKAQEKKVLELSMRSEISLHVAAMNKRNANEYYVYIPLRLLDNFKDTIQLEAHANNMVYDVGASKQSDDQIILQSELSDFVASHGIQDNDLLVFRSKGKSRLEVLVLDPSGCEKTCFAMGNSSNARELCEDSVEIVDPPLHTFKDTVIDLSSDGDEVMEEGSSDDDEVMEEGSSDDNEVVEEGMTTSRREHWPLRSCRAKAQKMASTSSPCTFLFIYHILDDRLVIIVCSPQESMPCFSGHKAGTSNETGLEVPMSNKLYILPEKMKLTSQQEEKVKEKVRAIGSGFPVFVKVMTVHDVLRPTQLCFCMEFTSACRLPLEQTPLLLGLEGSEMQWHTALTFSTYRKVRQISSLWRNFVSVSGMKAGDICLFELVDRSSERLMMTVHLIR